MKIRKKRKIPRKNKSILAWKDELIRKSVHVLTGLGLAALVWYCNADRLLLNNDYLRLGLAAALLVGIILSLVEKDLQSQKPARRIPFVSAALDKIERPENRKRFPGEAPIMYVAATLILIVLFQPVIVVTGLIILAIGDTIAHLYGRAFGKIKLPWDREKEVEGRIIAVLVCWGLLHVFWSQYFLFPIFAWWTFLVPAAAGMLVESLPLTRFGIDDNLTVPLVAALALYLVL